MTEGEIVDLYEKETGDTQPFRWRFGSKEYTTEFGDWLLQKVSEQSPERVSVDAVVSGTFVCAFCESEYDSDEHDGGFDKETLEPICMHCRAECELEGQ